MHCALSKGSGKKISNIIYLQNHSKCLMKACYILGNNKHNLSHMTSLCLFLCDGRENLHMFQYSFVQTEFCLLKNSKCFHIDSVVFFILFFIFIASHRVSAFCQHFNSNHENRVRRYGLVRLTA